MKFHVVEVVNPTHRAARLQKIAGYEYAARMRARASRLRADDLDRVHGNKHWQGTPANRAMRRFYKLGGIAQRARAILQKHTGKDYNVRSLDWWGGSGKMPPSGQRPSLKRRKKAVQVLMRARLVRRDPRAAHIPRYGQRGIQKRAASWLRRFRGRVRG
jgi:hypothetical protein